jgi:hypothetical protein
LYTLPMIIYSSSNSILIKSYKKNCQPSLPGAVRVVLHYTRHCNDDIFKMYLKVAFNNITYFCTTIELMQNLELILLAKSHCTSRATWS